MVDQVGEELLCPHLEIPVVIQVGILLVVADHPVTPQATVPDQVEAPETHLVIFLDQAEALVQVEVPEIRPEIHRGTVVGVQAPVDTRQIPTVIPAMQEVTLTRGIQASIMDH